MTAIVFVLLAATAAALFRPSLAVYNVGVGIGDITGPAAETNMMGYASPGQTTAGIHLRTYARAFIFEDADAADKKRVAFVSSDMGMLGRLIKGRVLQDLEALFPGVYNDQNLALSATHTHSGAGGYMQYFLFLATSLGFVEDSYVAARNGIVEAVSMAHNNMQRANVYWNEGELYDASINRSPTSYDLNPEEERAMYSDNLDHTFLQLMIESEADAAPLGLINWFSVHPTSMPRTNQMISGDHKGLASANFERMMNPPGTLMGKGPFVAAFASANLGDVSPNLSGPFCLDESKECDVATNTCPHGLDVTPDVGFEPCYAVGPGGEDYFESTRVIAERQFDKALELFNDKAGYREVTGPIDFIHQFVDMEQYTLSDGRKTCTAAMGYSFAAGTADGPSPLLPHGATENIPVIDFIVDILNEPTAEQEECHRPKPILLNTGSMKRPYAWHPSIIDTQLLRIGDFVVAALPGEFTTMSGRRMRNMLKAAAEGSPVSNVALSGLNNMYTHYVTTPEEYGGQRYEAASTIFGPNTLDAYLEQYETLMGALLGGGAVDPGPTPEDLLDDQITLRHPSLTALPASPDAAYGQCLVEPAPQYAQGDTVFTMFQSGNPWLSSEFADFDSFVYVDELVGGGWETRFTDAEWETKFAWGKGEAVTEGGGRVCNVTVEWAIPADAADGTYRIVHRGHFRENENDASTAYGGETTQFAVGGGGGRASRSM